MFKPVLSGDNTREKETFCRVPDLWIRVNEYQLNKKNLRDLKWIRVCLVKVLQPFRKHEQRHGRVQLLQTWSEWQIWPRRPTWRGPAYIGKKFEADSVQHKCLMTLQTQLERRKVAKRCLRNLRDWRSGDLWLVRRMNYPQSHFDVGRQWQRLRS